MTKAPMGYLTAVAAMMRSKAVAIGLVLSAFLPGTSYATQVFLTTGSSWTVPSDWNDGNNTIEIIGGGGGGGGGVSGDGGGGGGGGEYRKATNITLTPGTSVPYSIGTAGGGGAASTAGTTGGNTTFNTSAIVGHGGSGGLSGSSRTGGSGGSGGTGSVGNNGGSGGTGASGTGSAGGGGGSAGPHGAGNNGGNGTSSSSGAGGSGDAGSGGAGGAGNTTGNGSAGGNGTEYSTTFGSGGGGGGSLQGDTAGAVGGNYGAGGGGGGGAGSTGANGTQGLVVITYAPLSAPPPPTASAGRIFLTSGSSWTVPSNWNIGNNTIEVIGGGGGGGNTTPNAAWGGGGGGGAYSKITKAPLTPGSSVAIAVGAGGGDATSGGDTYLCSSTANCTNIGGTSVVVGAKGGGGGSDSASGGAPGAGGAASAGVGSLKTSGGAGGSGGGAANDSGGGAGGPHGNGNPGTANAGGSGDAGFGGAGGSAGAGGIGVTGTEWDSAHGSGGGAGRGGSGAPNTGGLYGGGGGGAVDPWWTNSTEPGGSGAQGIIVITYVPYAAPPPPPSSSATRTSSFAYDTTSGLLTQEVVEPNTSALRLETDYAYDAYGNKTSVTVSGVDIVTRSSTTTYDARGQFATSNANALGQSESWQYDPRFGTPTSHTGPNGLTTTWSYDTFGRKIQEIRADGTQTKWVYQFCSGVNSGTASCLSGASYLIQSTPYASDGATQSGPTSIVYLDSLDREIGRDTQGFDGSTVRATKSYDALGRVSQTSRPYFANGGTVELTTFTYDALGRVVKLTAPDNSVTQTDYHGLTVTDVNALNQARMVTKNSQGKVVSVTDALGQSMIYTYDAVGNLVQTTDAVGNVVTASYDTRGRKTASNDPDLGNWTYSYNTLGQLVSQTDAKGQNTTLSYDLLSRPVQRVEADMTSVWAYDSAANGIGKLAFSGVTAGSGAGFGRSVSYDTLGRPVQVATTISGTTYTMGAGYDANSRLTTVSYPSGFTAKYSYTNLGFANQLQDNGSGQSYWTANAMDATGHLTQQTSGNGLATTRTFDPTTGRLTSISTGSSGAVQNLSYTYDLLGNPLSRSDANTGLGESFVYDPLNRLTQTTVNLSTPLVKTFSYSAIGNLLSKSDVGNYGYAAPGSAQPHAVMNLSGGTISTTFTYDPNGNQTSGLGRNITYSSYNKPSSITQGTQTISFLDDTEHQRFQQVTPSGTTLYIAGFGVLAELSGAGTTAAKWTDYLAVGNAKVGMRVLQVASETLSTRYFHTDHLGSVSVISDENGNVLERLSYDAWGKRRFPNGADDPADSITSQTTRGFTGEEELSVSGLVHLNGRVYDPLLARFTSADPTVTDPLNPQGWNRYSYVGNDPLAFTDPNGFSWLSGFFNSIGNFFSGIVHSITHFIQTNTIARTILQLGLNILLSPLGPIGAAISAVVVAGLSGGNLSQILKAGLIAGVTAFAFFEVGQATPGAGNAFTADNFNPSAYAENVAGHALVGCAQSAASGGGCGSGALSGAIGSAVTPLTNSLFPLAGSDLSQRIGGTILAATAGGLASVAGGGKFANGAITAAFGYLDNAVAHMLLGSDAHALLAAYLIGQDPLMWSYNTTFGGLFGNLRPDLIYASLPLNVSEIKPDGSAALGAAQLGTYLNTPGAQAAAGDFNFIFKGASSLTLSGGWFGGTYTYSPSSYQGVVTYTYNDPELLSQIIAALKQPKVGGALLPPRLPPLVIP